MFSVRQGGKFQDKGIIGRNEQIVFKSSRQVRSKEDLSNKTWDRSAEGDKMMVLAVFEILVEILKFFSCCWVIIDTWTEGYKLEF